MKAAVLRAPRDLRVEAATDPAPSAGQALVRVRAAGLCGTDFRIWAGDRPGRYPLIMGHGFLGGGGGGGPRGREGNRNLGLSRTAVGIDVDGGFAELARIPARCCWPAPPGLRPEQLLLTEPLAVVVRAAGRGAVRQGETAAVLGAGTLGLLAVQVLKARGARVLAVSRSDRRLSLARGLGAEAGHSPTTGPRAGAG